MSKDGCYALTDYLSSPTNDGFDRLIQIGRENINRMYTFKPADPMDNLIKCQVCNGSNNYDVALSVGDLHAYSLLESKPIKVAACTSNGNIDVSDYLRGNYTMAETSQNLSLQLAAERESLQERIRAAVAAQKSADNSTYTAALKAQEAEYNQLKQQSLAGLKACQNEVSSTKQSYGSTINAMTIWLVIAVTINIILVCVLLYMFYEMSKKTSQEEMMIAELYKHEMGHSFSAQPQHSTSTDSFNAPLNLYYSSYGTC